MSKFIFILLVFISPVHADDWSQDDIRREQEYWTYHVLDWAQTLNISKHPDVWHEQTTALGLHPSELDVHRYFIAFGLAHLITSDILPNEYRAVFQQVSIAIKKGYSDHNLAIGINAGF